MRLLALTILASGMAAFAAAPEEEFTKDIKPVLQKYCYECHNAEKHKGDLNLSAYENLEQVKAAPDVWATVLERVQANEMPPPGKTDLKGEQPPKLLKFLRGLPQPPNTDCT